MGINQMNNEKKKRTTKKKQTGITAVLGAGRVFFDRFIIKIFFIFLVVV